MSDFPTCNHSDITGTKKLVYDLNKKTVINKMKIEPTIVIKISTKSSRFGFVFLISVRNKETPRVVINQKTTVVGSHSQELNPLK